MMEMASFWSYEENHEMEQLGEKLMCTTLELEKLKSEAVEEMRKNKDYIKQLIHLLKYAIQERDEARNQFQKLLNNTMLPSLPLFQSNPAKANSSVTESNSLSETYSTPVDSLFDAVSSPDVDQASLIIDDLAKATILPQRGNFLQAVLRAGPLLETLLVAGPLPTWRNPPQFQPLHIPPFSINADHKPYADLSCASVQVQASPMLNFGHMVSAPCGNSYAPLAKRQRFS
ncbi:uncharacterized protein LOC131000748 [Salvia miltiorrhiza]|uniref:uncharacterized protein LOC131000748 n=1 Tax=Salvia miltiorrhiza TaxID=226208 RepID=UPI0025AD56C3|nr:uncharacterized protein LOC131000748 [Salvia miltiorrhiza]XP_057782791.1 uncharacterized protein LOC131000748 [Salvia miltiorrhiza]XP_057782792.1 uncharacterized protein LOC131000748 [Salvia miltiorrhiza]